MKKIFLFVVFAGLLVFGSSAESQITQTSFQVNLSWTVPAASPGWSGCSTSAPCTFLVSKTPVTGTTCPLTASSYSSVGVSAPQATAYVDSSVTSGTSYCYVVQTQQASAVSGSSAPAFVVVPGTPGVPSTPSGTTTTVTVTVTTIP